MVRPAAPAARVKYTPQREGRPGGRAPPVDGRCFNPRPCARGDVAVRGSRGRPQCFNPRPCARGDSRFTPHSQSDRCFNPRPCARGDKPYTNIWTGLRRFQSTPLREGRPGRRAARVRELRRFNPRPCARGDLRVATARQRTGGFQSTPLREGRPPIPRSSWATSPVSIHAPARGATCCWRRAPGCPWLVSIHAPARGATSTCSHSTWCYRFNPRPCARGDALKRRTMLSLSVFQSTPLREGRPFAAAAAARDAAVSIHAPARGATSFAPSSGIAGISFNPRPCARGDLARALHAAGVAGFNPRPCARGDVTTKPPATSRWFQSTPLREGRQPRPCRHRDAQGVSIHAPARGATRDHSPRERPPSRFNPRPCARGDHPGGQPPAQAQGFQSTPLREGRHNSTDMVRKGRKVSIHAPARGATFSPHTRASSRSVSIHAPARGATDAAGELADDGHVSIHAPARGATCTDCGRDSRAVVSIHAPARGATRSIRVHLPYDRRFNPRPCARGDAHRPRPAYTAVWFQSTPLREGRHSDAADRCRADQFQSTPLREGRPLCQVRLPQHGRFNPRPCARGDTAAAAYPPWSSSFNPRPCARGDAAAS